MAQRYERVAQEDLNVGTASVWIGAPGGGKIWATQLGIHSVARGQVAYEAAWTPGAIAAGSKASTTVSVPDAATGDVVLASHDKIGTSDLRISGHISVDGTAKVVIHNPTAASITVAAGTVRVAAFPFPGGLTPSTLDVVYAMLPNPLTQQVDSSTPITFTPTVTPGVAPYTYDWDWGDGTAHGTTEIPDHTYSTNGQGGTYTCTLTVTDDDAETDTYAETFNIAGI